MLTRRDFVKAAGATAVGTATLSTPVTADHYEKETEHIHIEHDLETLKKYRPRLVLDDVANDNRPDLYGWVVKSTEYNTDMAVYWCDYAYQHGVSPFSGFLNDSHFGDHEPVYVEFSSESGTVERVIYSAYHWLAGQAHASELTLADETHPQLHVVAPWHQYRLTTKTGTFLDVNDLTAKFQAWLDNGLEDELEPGTARNPWVMKSRGHWWRETAGVSANAIFVNNLLRISKLPGIDIAGASQSDI